MKVALSMLLLVVTSLGLAAGASADSLYPVNATQTGGALNSLFADTKAHNVGDILTIVVTESATGSSTGDTKLSNSENASFGPGIGTLLEWIKLNGLSGSMNGATTNSTDRTDNLSATIAVTVRQVLPNGNLMIEGDRAVGINAETEHISLTGIVRPQDIGANNQVSSELVSDAQIHFAGKGPVGDTQHYGIITRLFHYLF